MILVEISCLFIVAYYVTLRLARATVRRPVIERLVLLSIASFIGEDSVIRVYHFYAYSRSWHLFVDRVPLLIVLIWPVVVDSSWVLAHRVAGGCRKLIPLVAAGFVLVDASLIEPIAVRAGLWAWSEPGLFGVPLIGILGWALFALCAVWALERIGAWTLVFAPLGTHVLLLATWWGALRWVNHSIASPTAALTAWIVLLPLAAIFWTLELRRRVPSRELMARLPGALFFFVLLAAQRDHAWSLVEYALAFVPPYLALWRR